MGTYEPLIRLASFAAVMLAMAIWEVAAPRRALAFSKPRRWLCNLTLGGINALLVRAVLALGAVGVAQVVQERGWGLLQLVALPAWLAVALAVITLDLAIYLQHVMFHSVPLFWRLHMVHHADPDFDVSTGLRFHALEIALSMGIKVAAIAALGPPPLAMLIFEVLLNATSLFNHSNVRMPGWLDALLRLVLVTPDMHRVHHSTIPSETNSNFGFNLPWWDYLLGTYRAQPRDGHRAMHIGLVQVAAARGIRLGWMLVLPFVAKIDNQAESTTQP